jgi:adenosylcobinamide-GDP ribazoletransferase
MRRSLHDIAVAFAFLTRVPVSHEPGFDSNRIARWFPLVGLTVGSASGAVYLVASTRLPALPSAALSVLASVLITGGFHVDGLADVCDGLVGGWTPQDRLRILKDSRHGTYGVLAIAMQVALQVSLVASLDRNHAFAALVATHTLARLAPVYLMAASAAPGQEGMGAAATRSISGTDIAWATVVAGLILVPVAGGDLPAIAAAVGVATLAVWRYARARIGGVVGDVFGAAEQVAETVTLLVCLILQGTPHA